MSSGGSQVTAATPWGPASPYLTDIMAQAKNLYGQQTPNYANPAANFGYGQATGAVGNALGMSTPYGSMATSLAPNTTAAIQKQLSGVPDYGAVKQSLDAANQQTWDSFNNTELPQLNQRASFLGNPSGSIKDLNWATANIGKNMDLNAQQQYLGQYNLAQQEQANAMGLGANIAQGAGSQALQAANLYPGIAQMPNQNLSDYASIIGQSGGKFGTSTETNKAGSGQTTANVIGGLTAGAGLINSLTGTPVSSGLTGAYNSVFGGSGIGASAGTIAGLGGDLAASTAAGEAGVAGDVAASNMAWLGAQPAAAGAGLGSGAAAAGVDAVGTGAAGAAGETGALGGGASVAPAGSGLGAVGNAALPIALFVGQKMLFDKQSAFTPGQQYKDILGQIATLQDPKTQAQMKAVGQDPSVALAILKSQASLFDQKTQTFRDVGRELLAGGATSAKAGSNITLGRNQF